MRASRSSAARCRQLNIDIICANSPQAKGRVERALRYAAGPAGEGAAAWREYRRSRRRTRGCPGSSPSYNTRFGRDPANAKDLHRLRRPIKRLAWGRIDRVIRELFDAQPDVSKGKGDDATGRRSTFFEMLGRAFREWALVEKEIFDVYALLVGTKTATERFLPARSPPSLSHKIDCVDSAVRGCARRSAPQLVAEWQGIDKRIRAQAKERNTFAHWTTHFGVNFDPPIGPWLAPPYPHPKHGDPSSRLDLAYFKAAIRDFRQGRLISVGAFDTPMRSSRAAPPAAERADKEGWPAARFLAALAELERARPQADRAQPSRGTPAAR